MLDTLQLQAWVARILGQLAQADFIELALVILNAEQPNLLFGRWRVPRRHTLLWTLYHHADRRIFRAELDPFAQVDVSDLLASVPTMTVSPLRPTRFEHRFGPEAIGRIREANLDVILRFGFNIIRGDILDSARCGVWSYHHGDYREYRGDPPFFWEMYEGNPVSGMMLQFLTEDLDGGRVLYRSFSANDPISLHRSRAGAFWKSGEFVMRRLTDLHQRGWEYLESLPEYSEAVTYDKEIYRAPTNAQMIQFLRQRLSHAVARTVRTLRARRIWSVVYRRVTGAGEVISEATAGSASSDSTSFRLIPSPRGRFYADPFVVEHQGHHYVLFEDCDLATRRAVISWACLNERGAPNPTGIALARDYHLSYPAVFRWNENWYMTPETADKRSIELFRAEQFPTRWVLDRVLVDDVTAFSPTIMEHDGRWWLFVNVAVPGGAIDDELFLYCADSPLGEWSPHPMNPIVSDVRCARPAGRVFARDGMLIRPSQDCSRGCATVFNRITTLTPNEYAETPIHRLEPGWAQGNLVTHVYNTDGEYEVMDALRQVSRNAHIKVSKRSNVPRSV